MRETELWERLRKAVGPDYVAVWADQIVLADLGGRTVNDGLAAGISNKKIWLAVWKHLELSAKEQ